ncbi:inactive serine protease PAMR1 [Engraulis encrasicolus]|uniref:inactive serine protease PAMR1 n=1 Tax=Engraulis encrasicolus TaxID=184585 RepID=UPI002FD16B0B
MPPAPTLPQQQQQQPIPGPARTPLQGTRALMHTRGGPRGFPSSSSSMLFISSRTNAILILLFLLSLFAPLGSAWPLDYRWLYPQCPSPEWGSMCRGCCEYELIRCKCPVAGTPVGYAVPCCRNAINECDPCIIHPGCSIFENCKRCHNGTWGPRDDFYIRGKYCSECRPGWSGGDCMKCGGVLRKRQGHIVLEAYPNNARCEWTIQVDRPYTIDLRFMMLSLEFHHSCRHDFVEVRDGDSIHSRVIGRFCGNDRPPPIMSSGNSLHILFNSDGYKTFDGFFAIFQESSACSSSPCLHDGTCVLDSSHSFHCACLAGYTGPRCEHVLMCGRPMMPLYGGVQSMHLHVGGHVIYSCNPGYKLIGTRIATCRMDGTWTAPAPQCVRLLERTCPPPPKPTYGDHFLVFGPNDVVIALQYLCYRPYKLVGAQQRTCLANGTWSGTAPTCVKALSPVPGPDKEKDKDGGQDKHPSGKDKADTKETDDTNMVKEKQPEKDKEKDKKGLDQGIQIIILKEPDEGADPKVIIDTGGKDIEISVDAGGQPKQPSRNTTTTDETEETNRVPEKEDSGTGPDVHVGKNDGDVIVINDLKPDVGKNVTTSTGVDVNTVEEKTSEQDKDKERERGDRGNDLGRDIDIVLLSEKGKTTVIKDVLIHTEYKVEKDENTPRPRHPVTTMAPRADDNSVAGRNTSDPISSNDIDNTQQKPGTREPDRKQHPVDGNITEASTPGRVEPGREGPDSRVGKDDGGERGSDTDSEIHPGKNVTTTTTTMGTGARPTESPKVPREETETDKDIKGGVEKGKDNQITAVPICPAPPRLYHGYHERVPGLSPDTVEFFCNHSYALSGTARRSCQPDGTWNGTMPICVRACREPKVSTLVKQTVLPPQVPFRKTPLHKFYSSTGLMGRPVVQISPTTGPKSGYQLPPGFHPLYTHIQYECLSPYYQHSGSSRRTCLKTGKWSGRHVSCSPVCGKIPNFDPQSPGEIHWPWLVAIYRRSVPDSGAKMGPAGKAGGTAAAGGGHMPGQEEVASSQGWELVCSGALVNQRSVVAAAHCVTELGNLYALDAARVKVVLGKKFRTDKGHHGHKGLQHLRVASIVVHPSYDPLLLDADVAVLRLLDKARIGEHVLPICLPERASAGEEETQVKQAVVTGWSLVPDTRPGDGLTRGDTWQVEAEEDPEEQARVGRVQLASDAVQCERQYARNGMPISVTENMFCGRQHTGGPAGGNGSGSSSPPSRICPADTGGILVLPAPTPVPSARADSSILLLEEEEESAARQRVWRLLGLVSFGYDHPECNPHLYTVYTRVANFVDFIESNMK